MKQISKLRKCIGKCQELDLKFLSLNPPLYENINACLTILTNNNQSLFSYYDMGCIS